jgi:hypothetical protein
MEMRYEWQDRDVRTFVEQYYFNNPYFARVIEKASGLRVLPAETGASKKPPMSERPTSSRALQAGAVLSQEQATAWFAKLRSEFGEGKARETFTRDWVRTFEMETKLRVPRPTKPPKSERLLAMTPEQQADSHLDIATRIERWGRGLSVEELAMPIPISETQI